MSGIDSTLPREWTITCPRLGVRAELSLGGGPRPVVEGCDLRPGAGGPSCGAPCAALFGATPTPRRIEPPTGVVYGPVVSRRFGRSLGVNLLPPGRRLCSMDCRYCQYPAPPAPATGRFPSPGSVLAAVGAALALERGLDAITLAGLGEPTLHPRFAGIVEELAALRDEAAPGVPLVLLTNGSRLASPWVRPALDLIERVYVKLDAADDATFRVVNRPHGFGLSDVLRSLLAVGPGRVHLQALFAEGLEDQLAPDHLARWVALVSELRPRSVQVTTVERRPAQDGLRPLEPARLEALAEELRARGVAAQAFPAREEPTSA